jgi:uncharacterized membrane protein YdjX (TVP38/TMEM64 family)
VSQATETAPASRNSRQGLVFKLLVGIAAAAALLLLGRKLGGYVPGFAEWVDGLGFWGPAVFILGYAAATLAFVPGSLLTMAAGAIFGLAKGTLLVFLGATTGATFSFLVARYLARSAIERRLAKMPRFRAIDKAVARQGLKIIFLVRLSPVFPYNLLNYGLGLTRVKLHDYVLACLGMIPGTFLYVYYGKALGSLAAVAGGVAPERGVGDWALLGVGLLATVAVTAFVAGIARRALNEEVAEPTGEEVAP